MTVLAKYRRLEAEGIWRPHPEAQRREVIVSIGEATLTIAAPNGTALAHWSLPAIRRVNPGTAPALYSPGEDAPESLELADSEMVTAVEKVLRAIHRGPGHPGRLRGLATLGIALLLALFLFFWLPGAIIRYTAALVPGPVRGAIDTALLGEVERVAGRPCSAPSGLRALENLAARLFPEGGTRLVVLPSALSETAHLPGGTILVGRALVEDFESPEVVAGYLLAEALRREARDPLDRILDAAGLRAALGLLSTGQLGPPVLGLTAEWLIGGTPAAVPESVLAARLKAAGIPGAAYGHARDISGETVTTLIGSVPETNLPVLEDGDWLALQRICDG